MSSVVTNSPSFAESILHALSDPMIWVFPVWNDDGTVADFEVGFSNAAADAGVNHPRGRLVGLRIKQDGVPSPQNGAENFAHFLKVYQSGEVSEHRFFAPFSNRSYETIRQVHEGGVLSVTRDRQAQREAERKEQETRRTLESIVNNSPYGIVYYSSLRDEAGKITDFEVRFYNERSNELLGISSEERRSLTFRQLLQRFGQDHLMALYASTVEAGKSFKVEQYFSKEDRWIQRNTVKLDDGFLAMISDITESKQQKQALSEAALRFQTVVDTSKAGMFTLTPVFDEEGDVIDFRFVIVNQAVASYIGQTAEVLKGSLASIYFPAYQSNGLFNIYKENYLTGKAFNFDFHYEDGYDVFFNIDVMKTGDEVLVTFTDHTALKRLQRELEARLDELKRSNASLEEFAHAASHDLKEPIRKVRTFADRLKTSLSGRLEENEINLFDRMGNATDRMRHLVDDLLQFAEVSSTPLAKTEVDLNEQLRMVLSDLEVQIEEKSAIITVDQLPRVQGYPRQLQQLLQNLLSNALKYNKPGQPPEIHVSATAVKARDAGILNESPDAPFHRVSVRDNGIGFDPQHAERIFLMFQRLHGRSEYAGTGVGLSIVRKVVQNHGGSIRANAELGAGANFDVYLPA